jgi:hypothetical protein
LVVGEDATILLPTIARMAIISMTSFVIRNLNFLQRLVVPAREGKVIVKTRNRRCTQGAEDMETHVPMLG